MNSKEYYERKLKEFSNEHMKDITLNSNLIYRTRSMIENGFKSTDNDEFIGALKDFLDYYFQDQKSTYECKCNGNCKNLIMDDLK